MKKSTMLAFTAAVLMSAASLTGHAASAPTYDDVLIVKNPVMTPQLGSVVLVPVASPQTVAAVHDYVKAWQNAEINIAKAKVKYDDHKQLTKSEKVGCILMINITMLTISAHIPSVVCMVKKCS